MKLQVNLVVEAQIGRKNETVVMESRLRLLMREERIWKSLMIGSRLMSICFSPSATQTSKSVTSPIAGASFYVLMANP
jgi:hypothetical protein